LTRKSARKKSIKPASSAKTNHFKNRMIRLFTPDHTFWNAMKSLYTEIEINAPVSVVWKIFTDFQLYPDWNPFIRSFDGIPEAGRQFSVIIQPNGKKPMTFKPVCLALIPEKEFRWLGHLGINGLFDGEHIFELKKVDKTRTLFIQRENFRGVLVPLLWGFLDKSTRSGFEEMNQQLKMRAESSVAA